MWNPDQRISLTPAYSCGAWESDEFIYSKLLMVPGTQEVLVNADSAVPLVETEG